MSAADVILRIFGMDDAHEPCPTCGHRRRKPAALALHKDPVALYLDGQIDADEMERCLGRSTAGMADPLEDAS